MVLAHARRPLAAAALAALVVAAGACAGRTPPESVGTKPAPGVAIAAVDAGSAARAESRGEPIVLVVSENGMSTGREILLGADAAPEAAIRRCRAGQGYVLFQARLLGPKIEVGAVVERSELSESEVRCISDALATIPLPGGMNAEQLVYVRLP